VDRRRLGSELLLERHEPRALSLALELVDGALADQGGGLISCAWPSVSQTGGWRLAWAVAGLAWRAAASQADRVALVLRLDRSAGEARLEGDRAPSEVLVTRAHELERELPSSRFDARADGWTWSFPDTWLEAGA